MKKGLMDFSIVWDMLKPNREDICCFIVDGKEVVFPHEIADHSLVFCQLKAPYEVGDMIVLKDDRGDKKERYRITKAVSENEKKYVGKLVLAFIRYDKGAWLNGDVKELE